MTRFIESVLTRWGDTISLSRNHNIYTGQEQVSLQAVHFSRHENALSVAIEIPLTQRDIYELKNTCEKMLEYLDSTILEGEREKGEWANHE